MVSTSHAIRPSSRSLANLDSGAFIDLENEASKLPQFDPKTCPDGLIDLSGAINSLMDDVLSEEMGEFVKTYDFHKATNYGDVMGPRELSESVSNFFNRHFEPVRPVNAHEIFITNGVTSLIDLMAFGMCDPGEGVMVITPTYMMFPHDVCARAGVRLIQVDLDSIDDQFTTESAPKLARLLSKTYISARKDGITPKALLLCNPSNPCGRTYPRKILYEIARFCGQRKMHLLSDEIYAMSTFTSSPEPSEALEAFTSVLSIPDDPHNGVFAENIHCMYGASKDFGCGGLRLGFLVTRNKLLWRSVRRLALFTWVSSFPTAFFTHFLQNETMVNRYLRTYRERLGRQYASTESLLKKNNIPFDPANSGIFVFIRLTRWLQHFEVPGKDKSSQEMKLCRYLLHEAGVFVSPGELSLSPVPGCFRLVYTGNPKLVSLAICRLRKALDNLEHSLVPATVEYCLEKQSDDDSDAEMKLNGIAFNTTRRRSLARLFLCSSGK